jgi:uncharacterized protein
VENNETVMYGRHVVFASLVGSHNYGTNTITSDRDFKVFVMPTFEDLYYGKMFSKSTISDTEDIDIHDIRKLGSLLYKGNPSYMESLFSKELWVNPYYSKLVDELLSNRESFAQMNLPSLFNAGCGMIKQKMHNLTKGTEGTQHLVDMYGYDTKNFQHGYRLYSVLKNYAASGFTNFDRAIHPTESELKVLRELRRARATDRDVTPYEAAELMDHWLETLHIKEKELYKNKPVREDLKQTLDDLIIAAVKREITSPTETRQSVKLTPMYR